MGLQVGELLLRVGVVGGDPAGDRGGLVGGAGDGIGDRLGVDNGGLIFILKVGDFVFVLADQGLEAVGAVGEHLRVGDLEGEHLVLDVFDGLAFALNL